MDNENEKLKGKRKLRLIDRYDNDDYSRYSTSFEEPEDTFEIGQSDENVIYPDEQVWSSGISGGPTKHNFYGIGPKGYKRKDERIYEDVCELLMDHSEIDASEIVVTVHDGVVEISGKVIDSSTKRLIDFLLEDLAGVKEVKNEVIVIQGRNKDKGPSAVTKNDLGIT